MGCHVGSGRKNDNSDSMNQPVRAKGWLGLELRLGGLGLGLEL